MLPEPSTPSEPRTEPPNLLMLIGMWFAPRATVRRVVDHGGYYLVLPLMAVFGFCTLQFKGSSHDDPSWLPWTIGLLVAAPIFGILGTYLSATIVKLSALLLGHDASIRDLAAAGAWGRIPMIGPGLCALPLALASFYGVQIPMMELAVIVVSILMFLGWLWGAFTHMSALGEVLGVSTGRALLIFLLVPGVLAGLILGLISMAFVAAM